MNAVRYQLATFIHDTTHASDVSLRHESISPLRRLLACAVGRLLEPNMAACRVFTCVERSWGHACTITQKEQEDIHHLLQNLDVHGYVNIAIHGNEWARTEGSEACQLLRCINEPPWRTGTYARAWEEWRTPLVMAMAQDIWETQKWSELGVLADALEDECCIDDEAIQHLRGYKICPCCNIRKVARSGSQVCMARCQDGWIAENMHSRGCWVLRTILRQ